MLTDEERQTMYVDALRAVQENVRHSQSTLFRELKSAYPDVDSNEIWDVVESVL